MKQINITITEEQLVALFGPDAIATLAGDNKYQTEVPNPDFVPAVGNEMIEDPNWVEGPDSITPDLILNPDYVTAVGTETIPNPESTIAFLGKLIATKGIEQVAKASRVKVIEQVDAVAKAQLKQFDDAVKVVQSSAQVQTTE